MRPHTVDYQLMRGFCTAKTLASSVGHNHWKKLLVVTHEDSHHYEVWNHDVLSLETTSLYDAVEHYNNLP